MTKSNGARLPRKGWLIALLAVVVVGIGAYGLIRMTSDNAGPVNDAVVTPSATATTEPTTASPTPTKKTSPTATPTCAKPGDLFNVEGADVETLPPDCGVAVVPAETKKPLGLGCGGSYPTIMYKTTTARSKTTICGTNSSGEDVRMVTKPNGSSALDLDSAYDPGRDAFVSRQDGATYTVEAYNGSLTVKKDGKSDRQASRDWISLDNESDYD